MSLGTQEAFKGDQDGCLLSVGHTSVWLLEPQELTSNNVNNNHEMGATDMLTPNTCCISMLT